MFEHILVPLDGTSESNAALPLARTVAKAAVGSITLLRVLSTAEASSGAPTVGDAESALQRIADELSASVPVAIRVRVGDPAQEILAQAAESGTDLVVMRTHGRGGLERAIVGSVAERVLAKGTVPLLLMRPGERHSGQIQKLLVPVDGSPGGAAALSIAVELARETDASVNLLEVATQIPTAAYGGWGYGGIGYYDPAWDEEALNSSRTYVAGMVERLRESAHVIADGQARLAQSVPETIVQVADETAADVIVMSTQALTGAARALLGSVADAVVRTAGCPVLLVHRNHSASGADKLETVPLAAGSFAGG